MRNDRPDLSAAEHALRRSTIISAEDLDQAERVAREHHVSLDRAAVSLGLLSHDQVSYLVAEEQGVELVFPTASGVDRDLLARFPAELLRRHGAVPLVVEADHAVVAFAEIPPHAVLDDLAAHAGMQIRTVLASPERIEKTLGQVLGPAPAAPRAAPAKDEASAGSALVRHLAAAFGSDADELRFEPSAKEVTVRVRAGGGLRTVAREPASQAAGIARRARALAELADAPGPQDAEFVAQVAGRDVPLRLVIVPGAAGELVVLSRRSVLREEIQLETCGLPAELVDWLRGPFCAPAGSADAASGIVLVAATDASLLTAFAACILDRVDASNAVVAVSRDAKLDKRGRVRVVPDDGDVRRTTHAVRASRPDVLFVDGGERAVGVLEAACAASDGARVIVGIVDRKPGDAVLGLLDGEPAPRRLARNLDALVFLDQCRALCSRCARSDGSAPELHGVRAPVGCDACDGRGYDGAELVVSGSRSTGDLRDRVASTLPGPATPLPSALLDLLTNGRVARADAAARIPSLERR